jgi:hypothetical protein
MTVHEFQVLMLVLGLLVWWMWEREVFHHWARTIRRWFQRDSSL